MRNWLALWLNVLRFIAERHPAVVALGAGPAPGRSSEVRRGRVAL